MQRDNVALWTFIGLVALGLAAVIAASRRRGGSWLNPPTADGPLWVPAAPAAVLLALSTPLVIWGAFTTMSDLAYSDPQFDAPGFLLQPIPGLLVGIAAVRCAHAVRKEERDDRPPGRTYALSTTIVAYAAAVLALLAALLSFAAMLGQGG